MGSRIIGEKNRPTFVEQTWISMDDARQDFDSIHREMDDVVSKLNVRSIQGLNVFCFKNFANSHGCRPIA